MLLPSAESLAVDVSPSAATREQGQPKAAQADDSRFQGSRPNVRDGPDIRDAHSDARVNAVSQKPLLPFVHPPAAGNAPEVYHHGGADYCVGDLLPDGRKVLALDGGAPVLSRRPTLETALEELVIGLDAASEINPS
jgi:hypothetical protein